MAFAKKKIDVNLSLGGSGGAVANLGYKGFRVFADIKVAGSQAVTAIVHIFGMSLSHMNQLSRVPWRPTTQGNNTIQIIAGDDVTGMSVVFEGTVISAFPDLQKMPQVAFRIDAVVGAFESVKPVEPTSFAGDAKITDVAGAIAKKMNLPLENNGVEGVLTNPYFWGTARQQMLMLGQASRIGWIQENGVCAIWPQDGHREGAGDMLVSKDTGMVTAPVATTGGIIVTKLFDRTIKYAQTMTVRSDVQIANGRWVVASIDLRLQSETPNGAWYASIFGVPMGG